MGKRQLNDHVKSVIGSIDLTILIQRKAAIQSVNRLLACLVWTVASLSQMHMLETVYPR